MKSSAVFICVNVLLLFIVSLDSPNGDSLGVRSSGYLPNCSVSSHVLPEYMPLLCT